MIACCIFGIYIAWYMQTRILAGVTCRIPFSHLGVLNLYEYAWRRLSRAACRRRLTRSAWQACPRKASRHHCHDLMQISTLSVCAFPPLLYFVSLVEWLKKMLMPYKYGIIHIWPPVYHGNFIRESHLVSYSPISRTWIICLVPTAKR